MRRVRNLTTSATFILTCGFLYTSTVDGAGHTDHLTATPRAPLIAFAQNGNIIVIHADGTHRKMLTNRGWNSSPHLSPDQRWIAFLGEPRSVHDHPPRTCEPCYPHAIWIVHADGSGTYEPIRGGHDHELHSWSPDSRFLAYSEGFDPSTLKVRIIALHQSRTIVRAHTPLVPWYSRTLAWSADGQRLAIPALPGKALCPADVPVVIADVRTWKTTRSTVHIPLERFGACPTPENGERCSSPMDGSFTWTPNGHHFELATRSCGNYSYLTGIWRVRASGGTASLVLGKPSELRQGAEHSPMLDRATGFEVSPNFRWIVTDPGKSQKRFWVSRRADLPGRYLPAGEGRGCILAEYTWLADSSGLAFITMCKARVAGFHTFSLFYRPLAGQLAKLALFTSKQFDGMEVCVRYDPGNSC